MDLENDIYLALFSAALVIGILILTWYSTFKAITRWREELIASQAREKKAKDEAEAANAENNNEETAGEGAENTESQEA